MSSSNEVFIKLVITSPLNHCQENMSTSSSTPTKKLPTTTPNGSNLSELDEEQRIEPMNKFPTLPGHVTSSSSDLKNLRLQNELLRQALTQR